MPIHGQRSHSGEAMFREYLFIARKYGLNVMHVMLYRTARFLRKHLRAKANTQKENPACAGFSLIA